MQASLCDVFVRGSECSVLVLRTTDIEDFESRGISISRNVAILGEESRAVLKLCKLCQTFILDASRSSDQGSRLSH